jgi:hypothetical protein
MRMNVDCSDIAKYTGSCGKREREESERKDEMHDDRS